MAAMSCDDMNKFLFDICDVITPAEKWFIWLASQDFEFFCFPGGTPGKGEVVMAYPAA